MSENKKQAIICDIDGCIVDTSWIWYDIEKMDLNGSKMWEYFDKNACDMSKNRVIPQVLQILSSSYFNEELEILIVTARSERIRPETEEMLKSILDRDFSLYMRPHNDLSGSIELKERHLKEILKDYEVRIAIDDEKPNLDMYAKYGIFCLWSDFNNNQLTSKEEKEPELVQA